MIVEICGLVFDETSKWLWDSQSYIDKIDSKSYSMITINLKEKKALFFIDVNSSIYETLIL